MDFDIEALHLSDVLTRKLKKNGILKYSQLLKNTEAELLMLPRMTAVDLYHIKEALAEQEFALPEKKL